MYVTRRAFLTGASGLLTMTQTQMSSTAAQSLSSKSLAAKPLAVPGKPLQFRITALPLLPGGDYSSVCAINNRGQAVGSCSNGQTIVSGLLRDTRAVLWQENTVRDLVEKQFIAPQGHRINDRGQVLLNWQYISSAQGGSVPPPEDYALLWDGKVQRVWKQHDGFLPTSLNNHGEIAGRRSRIMWQAARWQNGKAVPIIFPTDVVDSQVLGINDAGQMMGTFARSQDNGEQGLFVWLAGKLDFVPANKMRSAYYTGAMNAKGQITGIFRETDTRIAHLFLWKKGKLLDRGAIGREGLAYSINLRGDMVGKADWGAFLATDGKPEKLSNSLPPDSGWTLYEATGINDKRQIVGNGEFQGQRRAFLLTLAP